jgi:hypothetical protein
VPTTFFPLFLFLYFPHSAWHALGLPATTTSETGRQAGRRAGGQADNPLGCLSWFGYLGQIPSVLIAPDDHFAVAIYLIHCLLETLTHDELLLLMQLVVGRHQAERERKNENERETITAKIRTSYRYIYVLISQPERHETQRRGSINSVRFPAASVAVLPGRHKQTVLPVSSSSRRDPKVRTSEAKD